MSNWGRYTLSGIAVLFLVFLVSPVVVVVVTSFSSGGLLTFPPSGFSFRWYTTIFQQQKYLDAIQLSFILAIITAFISTVLGTMAALAINRWNFLGKEVVNSVFLSPLVLPQVIIGVSLLQLLGAVGLQQSFTGLLIGHVVITIPYVIRTVQSTLVGFNRSLEEASEDLGANRLRTFWSITLPLIKQGVIAGWLFAFVISWINVEVSIFLVPSVNAPIPVQIFNYIQYSVDPSIAAISAISIYVAIVLLIIVDFIFGLDKFASF